MSKIFVVMFMVFMHILDDYKIQAGVLAFLKQKKYWEENAPEKMYRFDYIAGLIMHGLSWSFMMMLPIAIVNRFDVDVVFFGIFIINAVVHAIIDDMKANRGMLNLLEDQAIHILQILATAITFLL